MYPNRLNPGHAYLGKGIRNCWLLSLQSPLKQICTRQTNMPHWYPIIEANDYTVVFMPIEIGSRGFISIKRKWPQVEKICLPVWEPRVFKAISGQTGVCNLFGQRRTSMGMGLIDLLAFLSLHVFYVSPAYYVIPFMSWAFSYVIYLCSLLYI